MYQPRRQAETSMPQSSLRESIHCPFPQLRLHLFIGDVGKAVLIIFHFRYHSSDHLLSAHSARHRAPLLSNSQATRD